jgi:hypothetical protein
MPGKALLVSVPAIVIAAAALCWLAPLQGVEAAAERSQGYLSVSTQLFDGTPVGGALHTISPAPTPDRAGENRDVKAQVFDPDIFGAVRSKFSGAESIVSGPDAGQPKVEGRSVGTSDRLLTTPILEISPGPPRQCEPGSTRKLEPQYGALERSHAAA